MCNWNWGILFKGKFPPFDFLFKIFKHFATIPASKG